MPTKTIEISESNAKDLPEKKSVYSVWAQSKSNNEPINCRYVGETENLQNRTQEHFSDQEENDCLNEFMQSTKTKILIYELMPGSTKEERMAKETKWVEKFNPECNK